jgi:hypothetical protein
MVLLARLCRSGCLTRLCHLKAAFCVHAKLYANESKRESRKNSTAGHSEAQNREQIQARASKTKEIIELSTI